MKRRILAGLLTFVMAFSTAATDTAAAESAGELASLSEEAAADESSAEASDGVSENVVSEDESYNAESGSEDESVIDAESDPEQENDEEKGSFEPDKKYYMVTLDAGDGLFDIEDDKQISSMEIFVNEGDVYDNSRRYPGGDKLQTDKTLISGYDESGDYMEYDELPRPEREGYDFVCWYTLEDYGDILLEENIITGDKKVLSSDWEKMASLEGIDIEDAYKKGRTFYAVWRSKSSHDGAVEKTDEDGASKALSTDMSKEGSDIADSDEKEDNEEIISGSENDSLTGAADEITDDAVVFEDGEAVQEINDETLTGMAGVEDGIWIADIPDQPYTGLGITFSDFPIYHKTTLLKAGQDYTLSYKNNKNLGTATVTAALKGNYTGKISTTFEIVKNNIEHLVTAEKIQIREPALSYNGKVQKAVPEITVFSGNAQRKLKSGTDFECEYPDNSQDAYIGAEDMTEIREYTVVIKGINGFEGTINSKEKIYPKGQAIIVDAGIPISKAAVDATSFEYNGMPKSQKLTYTDKEGTVRDLEEGTDYTVSYAPEKLLDEMNRPVHAGKITATYTGKNEFSGTVKKTFKILPFNITANKENMFTAVLTGGTEKPGEAMSFPYTKGGTKAQLDVKFGEETLIENTDYTLSYANNKAAGGKKSATVTVKGKGDFSGSLKAIEFKIIGSSLNDPEIVCAAADKVYAYKAGNYKTSLTVMDRNGKKLTAGTDYDKEFFYYYAQNVRLLDGTDREADQAADENDIVPADTLMKVVVCGKGNYAGDGSEIFATYRIVTADIAKAKVSVTNQRYTGQEIRPDKSQIQVKLSGKLLKDEDYEIAGYDNNINKGKAKITLKGTGDYGGSKTATFTIESASSGFTVIFNGNGATSGKMKNRTGKSGNAITLDVNKFKRDGFTFKGWNTLKNPTPENPGEVYADKGQIVAREGANITLYAQWIPGNYRIIWHLSGGENNPGNTKTSYSPEDETFEILSPENWKPGYQFGGWYTDAAYKNRISVVKKGSFGDLHLYAKWVPYTYKVTFNANGGSGKAMPDQVFSYGVPKKLSANKFKKQGFAFAGWALNSGDDEPFFTNAQEISGVYNPDKTPAAFQKDFGFVMPLYAVWKNSFAVEYDKEGTEWNFPEESAPVRSYNYGEKTGLVVTPVRPGYAFGGWYLDPQLKKSIKSISAKTTGNLHLYPKWNPYKVTFELDGNGADTGSKKSVTLLYSDTMEALADHSFVKRGVELTGWSTQQNNEYTVYLVNLENTTVESFIKDSNILGDAAPVNNQKFTLYAKWQAVDIAYSITYHTFGGVLPEGIRESYSYGEDDKYYDLPPAQKDGDKFLGWYTEPQYRNRIERLDFELCKNIELYAKWENNDKDAYTVSFASDFPAETTATSGKMKDQKLNYSVAKAISKNAFKAKGYAFKGWSVFTRAEREKILSEDPSATFNYYGDSEVVTGFEDKDGNEKVYRPEVKLYAVWELESYKVSLCNVGAAGIEDSVTEFSYTAGQTIVFDGPRHESDGKKYIKDDGEDENAAVRYLAEPYALGDTFLGWYSDKKLKKKVTGITAGSTGDKVFYAKWEKTRYTINYDLNAGTDESAQLHTENAGFVTNYQGRYESGYLLATATRDKYTFGGWYKEKSCKHAVGNIIGSPYVDMTVYAKWLPGSFTIVFDKNDPDATGTMKDMKGLRVNQRKKLTKNAFKLAGKEFVCWSTVPNPTEGDDWIAFNDGEEFYAENDKGKRLNIENGDVITLYALWQLKQYKINYHLFGGINDISVAQPNPEKYDETTELVSLVAPIRSGYDFRGWYRDAAFTEAVEPDPENPDTYAIKAGTTGDLDFYAKWERNNTLPDESELINAVDEYEVDNTGVEETAAKINQAIKKATENAGKHSGPTNVYLPAGEYKITIGQDTSSYRKTAIRMRDNVHLYLDENAVLKMSGTSASDDSSAIVFMEVENASVSGGKLVGAGSGADIYGVWIKGCENISVSDMEISGMNCDGIYIATQQLSSTDYHYNLGNNGVSITNCTIHHNKRNNITLTDGDNIMIENCTIYNAGDRQPCSGICIEPNPDCSGDGICSDIYIKDSSINSGKSGSTWQYRTFYTYNRPECHGEVAAQNVTIDNCILKGYYGNYSGRNIRLINGTDIDGERDG